MFVSRPRNLIIRNCFLIKTQSTCKSTNTGKPNVIKSYNAENKYLFGNLLETKKERRKKLAIGLNQVADCPDPTIKSVAYSAETATKKSGKVRKSKNPENGKTLPDASPFYSLSEALKATSKEDSELSTNCQKPKRRTRKLKVDTESMKSSPIEQTHEEPRSTVYINKPPLSEEFVFKSPVNITETNYPLDNPDKVSNFTKNCSVAEVLNYGFSDPLVKEYMRFPSVSKIMEETMSPKNRMILNKWRDNMVVDLGEERFNKHCADLKARGQDFHQAVRNTVLGQSTGACSDTTRSALKSLAWMLEHVSHPLAVESVIAHPALRYKGVPDCVAMFRNVPVVIDWKLSDKPKKELKDTYEAPVQITAYIGALNHDPNYKWGVSHGLVAVAYTSGDPCDVFLLAPQHCQIYWRHWLQRFDKFKARTHLHIDHDIDEKALQFI